MRFISLHKKSSLFLCCAFLLLPLVARNGVADTPTRERLIQGGGSGSIPLAFLDHGRTLAGLQLSRDMNLLTFWDVKSGKVKHVLQAPVMQAFAFSHSGKTLATGSASQFRGEVQLWDVATGKLKRSMPKEKFQSGEKVVMGPVFSLAFSGDDSTLAVGVIREGEYKVAGEVIAFNTSTGQRRQTAKINSTLCTSMTLSPDGQVVAAMGGAHVELCSMTTGQVLHNLPRSKKYSPNYVDAACFSRDGRLFYSSSRDRTIKVWNTKTGVLSRTLTKVGEPYRPFDPGLIVSPDGKMLAMGGVAGIHLVRLH